jgi:Domain of unknown function DUF29
MGKASSLYDEDFYAWTESQASELRRLAAKPDLSNVMDWENLIEEVETLGRSDLRAADGYLVQCIAHLIKLASAPDAVPAETWRAEIVVLQVNFQKAFAASMRRKFDMDFVWRSAIANAEVGLWREGLRPSRLLPKQCPFEVDAFLGVFSLEIVFGLLGSALASGRPDPRH